MLTIARSELLQLVRNRSVLVTSLLMPVAACVFFIRFRDVFAEIGSLGYVAAVIVFTIGAFSLYATTVTTLAARRQSLFLKRLRCTAAGDGAILSGLVLPISVIALLQVVAILAVLAVVSDAPGDLAMLALAIVATLVMMLALGTATAGVTRSPEHAQITTLPVSLGVVAVASWVGITGTDTMTVVKRLVPGVRPPNSSWPPGTAGLHSVTRCCCWVPRSLGWSSQSSWLPTRFDGSRIGDGPQREPGCAHRAVAGSPHRGGGAARRVRRRRRTDGGHRT